MDEYEVQLGLTEDDWRPMSDAAWELKHQFDSVVETVIMERRRQAPASAPDEPPLILAVSLVAESSEAARAIGQQFYRACRSYSSLPPALPLVKSVLPEIAVRGAWRSVEFRRMARTSLQDGNYEFAVIAAQTAAELYMEHALSEMLRRQQLGSIGEIIPALLSGFSMRDKRGQLVWNALTSEEIQRQSFWREYVAHVDRRNGIVHRGQSADENEARRSIEAVHHFVNYVIDAWGRTW